MKHLTKLLPFFYLMVLGLGQSCQKSEESTELIKCNLTGKEIITIENKTATLIYTNNINGVTIQGGGFFLINTNIEGVSLPLKVCNFPKDKFQSIAIGDNVKVSFSGRIELLPETVDAFNLNIELESIREISLEAKN